MNEDCVFQNTSEITNDQHHRAKWVVVVPLNGMLHRYTQNSCGRHLSWLLESYPVSAVINLKFYQDSFLKGSLVDFNEEPNQHEGSNGEANNATVHTP